jgi:hypothetical protein
MSGNSRQRRQLRRLLVRLGVPPVVGVAMKAKPITARPWWKSLPAKIVAVLTFVGLLVTLLPLWPRLSMDKSGSLDSSNPLKTMFYVTNEGILPMTGVDVTCYIKAYSENRDITVNCPPIQLINQAKFLPYKSKLTLRCDTIFGDRGVTWDTASLTIVIDYGVLFIPVHSPQVFHVVGAKSAQNTWEWIFRE